MAFHGAPRYTGAIDLYVRSTGENAKRILAALDDFGFGDAGLSHDDFVAEEQVIRLGVPPIRIDILTSLTGVSWEACWSGKVAGNYDTLPVFTLGRRELVETTRAAGRRKDMADIEALGEAP